MNSSQLILLRLKGFAKSELLADGGEALIAAGHVELARLGLRLTAAGRAAADAAWTAERTTVAADSLERVHAAFVALNTQFKTLVADWQLRNGMPNDHTDAAYDADIIARLATIDDALGPVLVDATALVARLERYQPAFAAALERLRNGEARWMAAPIIDSYHTLWFELHEELIRLTGRTRAAEAAAGHAA